MKTSAVIFSICFLLFISCLESDSSSNDNESFVDNLKDLYPMLNAQAEILPIKSSILKPNWLIPLDNCESVIIIDDSDKTIKLMGSDGHIFSEVGGEGRGPNEFKSIINPFISKNNRLYIIDGILFRITEYEIENQKLNFVKTSQFSYPNNYHLSAIYVNDYGRFGVFSKFESYFKPDNQYLLYRLNEDFEIVERLLVMPGNERPRYEFPEFTMFLDNIFAERTYWDLEGEWFYFIRSHQATVEAYNLKTGEVKKIDLEIGDRENRNEGIITFMKQKLAHIDDVVDGDQYWDVLEKSKLLPIFWNFSVSDNKILLPLFFPKQEKGIVILLDIKSVKVTMFNAPHNLERLSICNQTVYGINLITAENTHPISLIHIDY